MNAPGPLPPAQLSAAEVGGVHVKYLYHCRRQLWLYVRGIRLEQHSTRVALGELAHEEHYPRARGVDLGSARIDWLDRSSATVREVKSSRALREADVAQLRLYCRRVEECGVDVRSGVLHYPAVRKTVEIDFDAQARRDAREDIEEVLRVVALAEPPPRLERTACAGCAYIPLCWGSQDTSRRVR